MTVGRSRLAGLTAACAVCAVLWVATVLTRPITPAVAALGVQTTGSFALNGQFAGEPLAHAAGLRFWGSWSGSDAHTGALALGPFAAPRLLRLALGGYPTKPGNQLYLELVPTGAHLPVEVATDVGERWRIIQLALPPDWTGKPVILHARDAATGLGGWLAVSEPVRGGRGTGAEFLETLTAWSVNGLLFALLWFAVLHRLPGGWVPPPWTPLVAAGFVALLGYAAFWAYFAHPLFGKIVSGGVLALALVGAVRGPRARAAKDLEAPRLAKFLACIGLLYIALLHLFPSALDFDSLAANRFREGLPGDNSLPRNVANALFHGEPLRQPGAEWQSSDRPPLQSGWLLLTLPVTHALNLDERTANGTAALWLQSLWIFAAYGLFRSLGLSGARASALLPVLAISGFFAQNTVFTWPKLSAGAFACGAFALWLWPRGDKPAPAGSPAPSALPPVLLGALLAGLAWLSHGGVAFSFLALVPWLLCRALSGAGRPFLLAGLLFALLAAPWLAYQKFYDPPGDRLLKMHLAAFEGFDSRSAWQTVREAYGRLTWYEFLAHKQANFRLQLGIHWQKFCDPSFAGAPLRRDDEFFRLSRGLTWWWLGLLLLPVALAGGGLRPMGRRHATLAAWTLLTILVWCLLMFWGGKAVIHQGSYAVVLGLFVLLSAWCEAAGRWTIALLAGLQAVSFATTWAVSNATIHGPLNLLALGFVAAALGSLGFLVWRGPCPASLVPPPAPPPLPAAAPPGKA
ncbi:MAG: hypothetical protein NTV51_27305 [Verrucomicrobia bacterium]|nr:hypothetical protein [Verrucomicrobiota bacterium]